jgi:hypothetical protein
MSNPKPQSFKNHTSFDPWFHIFLTLVLVLNLFHATVLLFHRPNFFTAWAEVMALTLFVLAFKIRTYPLKVQDRVIRLEERLRLRDLAPAESKDLIAGLSEDQLIGLRFASDEEVIALAHQALAEKLNRKQIKERIKTWRPDYWRV